MLDFTTDWSSFRYCPKCGSGDMRFHGKKLHCRACGFTFYINPALAIAALIVDDQDRLLVVTRAHEPAKGTWDLPGGFADPGESAEEVLKREIQEELGVNITTCHYVASAPNIYPYLGVRYHTTDLAFHCQVDYPDRIQAADDITDAEFIPFSEIDLERFGMPSIRKIVAEFLKDTEA